MLFKLFLCLAFCAAVNALRSVYDQFLNMMPNILIYVQQDTTLHSLFYPETALHVSGGTITHLQERRHLYLQHLVFVTPSLLPVAIVQEL